MVRPLVWVAVMVVSVMLVGGCQSEVEKQMPLRPAGEARLSDVEVPVGFKYEKEKSWLHADDRIRLAHLCYTGKPPVVKAVQFFLDQMPMRNWKLSHQTENFGYTSLVFSKGPEVCTVTLYRSWGTTYVTIDLTKQPD